MTTELCAVRLRIAMARKVEMLQPMTDFIVNIVFLCPKNLAISVVSRFALFKIMKM